MNGQEASGDNLALLVIKPADVGKGDGSVGKALAGFRVPRTHVCPHTVVHVYDLIAPKERSKTETGETQPAKLSYGSVNKGPCVKQSRGGGLTPEVVL